MANNSSHFLALVLTSLVLIISSVAASQKYTKNFTLGHRVPGDRLEFHGFVEKSSSIFKPFSVIKEEKTFKASAGNVISCIIALDRKTHSPEVKISDGGLGSERVTIKFKSQSGHGINHEIYIYSQPRTSFVPSSPVMPQPSVGGGQVYPTNPSSPAQPGFNVYPGNNNQQQNYHPGNNNQQHPGNVPVFGGNFGGHPPVPSAPSAPSAGSLYPSLPPVNTGVHNQYPSQGSYPVNPHYNTHPVGSGYQPSFNTTHHGKNNTLIVGSRSFQDSLELQESITKPAEVSVKHKFNKNFKIRKDYKISQVVVEDRGFNGAKAKYEEFGPGHNNVTIEFESERGKGVDFVVRLYGHH